VYDSLSVSDREVATGFRVSELLTPTQKIANLFSHSSIDISVGSLSVHSSYPNLVSGHTLTPEIFTDFKCPLLTSPK
jgi:hypothetical protein